MPKKIGSLILYSIDDLHEKLGVSKLTLRSYLRTGRIRGRKLGVSWYVTQESLQDYFNAPERRRKDVEKLNKSNAHNYRYIIQGINDLVSETEECETRSDVIELLQRQAILSLFQVKIIERNSRKVIQVLKARDFIEQHGAKKDS
ncbi:MAG: DNA-binding protein [Balneola sp.]|nr:DNA-binding protein [Balneola sp.]|tara:strand:- start:3232 stop:3666 length:435 start_codon:yes stop_codon:yes gene_type:complete